MNPLNDMRDALVSINNILERQKQTTGDSYIESNEIEKANKKRELPTDSSLSLNNIIKTKLQSLPISELKSPVVESQNKSIQLHFESLTEDNFYHAHLCNRSIDELPNINSDDIKQLKLINVHTMQDLLGRFLIHDTSEEFYTFLLSTFQLSKKTASTITHLLHQWTKHNLDGMIDNKNIDGMIDNKNIDAMKIIN